MLWIVTDIGTKIRINVILVNFIKILVLKTDSSILILLVLIKFLDSTISNILCCLRKPSQIVFYI